MPALTAKCLGMLTAGGLIASALVAAPLAVPAAHAFTSQAQRADARGVYRLISVDFAAMPVTSGVPSSFPTPDEFERGINDHMNGIGGVSTWIASAMNSPYEPGTSAKAAGDQIWTRLTDASAGLMKSLSDERGSPVISPKAAYAINEITGQHIKVGWLMVAAESAPAPYKVTLMLKNEHGAPYWSGEVYVSVSVRVGSSK